MDSAHHPRPRHARSSGPPGQDGKDNKIKKGDKANDGNDGKDGKESASYLLLVNPNSESKEEEDGSCF